MHYLCSYLALSFSVMAIIVSLCLSDNVSAIYEGDEFAKSK
jgi:hypothetical protein